ncbi:carbohydrate ABC transporter [Streptomyces albidoflavus]|uniref:carbohydrate ABC transporter n=1 Tax=Streptomyces albidoflavus TaxID=1886 RepID=UPI002253C170|nr:carbohydrate ABC transporter [Streptomyces albidoflavus]MCX4468447.1 carbohydrate ABC transporter [Streptomyces albidoflavus]
MNRPLLKSEIKAQNSRAYLMKQQQSFIEKHGEDLGTFYFLMMLIQTFGKKALRSGDLETLRMLVHDLNAIYRKYTQ